MLTLPFSVPIAVRRVALGAVISVVVGGLAGCVVYPTEPVHSTVYVPVAPPAPLQEVVTVAPVVGMVWVPGYWTWTGVRYQWYTGRWAYPPAGRGYWHPGYWQQTPRGHFYVQGRWHARPYVAPAARPMAVVPPQSRPVQYAPSINPRPNPQAVPQAAPDARTDAGPRGRRVGQRAHQADAANVVAPNPRAQQARKEQRGRGRGAEAHRRGWERH